MNGMILQFPLLHPQICHDVAISPNADDDADEDDDDEDEQADRDDEVVDDAFVSTGKELPLLWKSQEQVRAVRMDCSIWKNLPQDVIERVIAFLHVPDAIRTSVVSKEWNSITRSPNFRKICAECGNTRSHVFIFQCELQSTWLAAYDSVASRWYSITLNFLPSHPTAPFKKYTVVSASGGLLCLWPEPRSTWKSVGLVVCNPVTRHWKELPCRSHDCRMPDLVVISVDNTHWFYKVLVITETSSRSKTVVATEVYDSRSSKWKVTAVETSSGGKFKSTVLSAGKVFCIYEESTQWHKIRVYDMEEQRWASSLSLPTCFYENQEVFETPELLDCSGNLLLVGRLGKHSCREEVVIWILTPSVSGIDSWTEVERMPRDIAREFLGCLVFGHYYCISCGDRVFFIASFKAPMLVYNLVEKTWSWWAWPFYEKYASRFPIFGFVKVPLSFPPFGFALDLRFDVLV